jgi:hypothetical protein
LVTGKITHPTPRPIMPARECSAILTSALLLLGIAGGSCGCSSRPTSLVEQLDPVREQLLRIWKAYHLASEQLRRAPANADELKPFLREVGDPDSLLRSPNDGEQFVIQWGVDILKPVPSKQARRLPVLAHEKLGRDGKRQVLTILGSVSLMTEEELAKTIPVQ